MDPLHTAQAAFKAAFGAPPSLAVQAPGRVNLIGEHTDYNDGFVLPCAIDYRTVICGSPRHDGQVRVVAADYGGESDAFALDTAIEPCRDRLWANYVRGVVLYLREAGHAIGGADLAISGNVPQGAGLSSSASLEVATGQFFSRISGLAIDRRLQCEAAARFFGVKALRDVDVATFAANAGGLDPLIARRARHIITDSQRALDLAAALPSGDMRRIGQLMADSHASMRDDFAITCPQVDALVDIVKEVIGDKGGVRMTGGGFGGCVVALVPHELVDPVRAAVSERYPAATGLHASIYVCQPSEGAGVCG